MMVTMILTVVAGAAWAHGERTHSPSLRMRSVQWYDVKWKGAGDMKVGDKLTISGKMFFPSKEFWPEKIKDPDPAYLQTSGPAAVFTKRESYINKVPMAMSAGLQLGRTYNFKLVMQARMPGNWHIHPALQVHGTGAIVGPGAWTHVTGSWADYKLPIKAGHNGQVDIANLGTYGMGSVIGHHILWFIISGIWLIWWIRRPTLVARYRAIAEGVDKHLLITRQDVIAGVVLLAVTVVLVVGGAVSANTKYHTVIPLQTGKVPVDPLPKLNSPVIVKGLSSNYNVPKRSMDMKVRITNNADRPVRVGEFATAGIRFVRDPLALGGAAGQAVAKSIKGYPADYIRTALKVQGGGSSAIAPGETRTVTLDATDAVWQIQGLSRIVLSPVRRVGGLVFLYDDAGNRYRQYVDTSAQVTYDIK